MTERRWRDEASGALEARAAQLLREGDAGAVIVRVEPRGARLAPARRALRFRAVAFAAFVVATAVVAAVGGVRMLNRTAPTAPPAPPVVHPPPSRVVVEPGALEQEAALLRQALAALAQKDPERALTLLGSPGTRTSELAVDRTVVEARALSMLARYDEALVRFQTLSREHLTPGLMLLWADAHVHVGHCAAAREVLGRLEDEVLSDEEEATRGRLFAQCKHKDKR
jgi:hypothetical protein